MITLDQLKSLIIQNKQEMFFEQSHKEKTALKLEQEQVQTQGLSMLMGI